MKIGTATALIDEVIQDSINQVLSPPPLPRARLTAQQHAEAAEYKTCTGMTKVRKTEVPRKMHTTTKWVGRKRRLAVLSLAVVMVFSSCIALAVAESGTLLKCECIYVHVVYLPHYAIDALHATKLPGSKHKRMPPMTHGDTHSLSAS